GCRNSRPPSGGSPSRCGWAMSRLKEKASCCTPNKVWATRCSFAGSFRLLRLAALRGSWGGSAPLGGCSAVFPGPVEQVWRGEPLPLFDLHCPLMTLPLALGVTPETIPCEPYLAADPDLVSVWRQRISALRGLRVGLVWAGRPGLAADARRSMAFERLGSLAS